MTSPTNKHCITKQIREHLLQSVNTGDDFFLHDRLNHFCAKVVDGLHLGGLEGNFADFGPSARRRPVDLNLNNLTLDYFCLFPDSNTDRLSEGL